MNEEHLLNSQRGISKWEKYFEADFCFQLNILNCIKNYSDSTEEKKFH